jgi:hypothetical protein
VVGNCGIVWPPWGSPPHQRTVIRIIVIMVMLLGLSVGLSVVAVVDLSSSVAAVLVTASSAVLLDRYLLTGSVSGLGADTIP